MFSPVLLVLFLQLLPPSSSLEFFYNSFTAGAIGNLTLTNDSRLEPPVIRLTNDSNQFSLGHAFYSSRIPFRSPNSTNATTSFSTQFVFSILPQIASSPGFGIAFVISNTTAPPNAIAGQYFGLFSASPPTVAPLIAIEFDTGLNPEFNDPDGNHIGIDLNSAVSAQTQTAGYYTDSDSSLIPVEMRSGQNIHAWIDFDGAGNEINVTIAPAGMSRPARPLLTYTNPQIAEYIAPEMFVGFSASKTEWIEAQRVLAWSFSDVGAAREINTTGMPVFRRLNSGSSVLSNGVIAGITVGAVFVFVLVVSGFVYWWIRRRGMEEMDDIEDWEMEYWPHRYSYNELSSATNGFSDHVLLGSGGFGKVYKGTLVNNMEVAVKCVNHDSKQGLREFMAEISSMGRLQHKNLVQMRGWCRRGNELMLIYDYMPNGSLNKWIFDKPSKVMSWEGRKRILADVAEGLNYLHHGWDQIVVHRDVKSSNVLLDGDMRGRLGDFGLAKLYAHGEVPNTTRVVGTLGYLAPEVVTLAVPTAASDVYSFGVVVLEVACGRRPIETAVESEDEEVLIDWVRNHYVLGKLLEVADKRIQGEYELEEMESILKLGLSCCHPDPLRRPTMKEVTAALLGEHVAMAPRDLLYELTPTASFVDEVDGVNGQNDESQPLRQV